MKWMKQFGIILLISFVGEILEKWIPLPIPASIYGIILLFLCLKLNIIPHEKVPDRNYAADVYSGGSGAAGDLGCDCAGLAGICFSHSDFHVGCHDCFRQSHTVCDSAKEKGCAGKPCLIF